MAKITALPRVPTAEIDGAELVPVVKGDMTMSAPLGDIVAPVAQPFVDRANAAAGAAEAVIGKLYTTTAEGLADTQAGKHFVVDNGSGISTVWYHAEDGSAQNPRTMATTGAMAAPTGAAMMGTLDAVPVQDAIDNSTFRVGLWAYFESYPLRQPVRRIITSGHSVNGRGSAVYRVSNDQVSAATPWRKRNAACGVFYELEPVVFGVTPMHFGAAGDYNPEVPLGGTDDDMAVADWMQFSMTRANYTAYPSALDRLYVVSRQNFLASWALYAATVRGLTMRGDGYYMAGFVFRPSPQAGVTDFYCLDGLAAAGNLSQARKLLFLQMENLRFIFDAQKLTTERMHFARQSGWSGDGNPQQGWTFRHLFWSYSGNRSENNGDILQIVGTANGSENSFQSCRAVQHRSVIVCSNAQAVNHSAVDCHWELGTGTVYDFPRGGALTHTGGSIIIDGFTRVQGWRPGYQATAGSAIHRDGRRYLVETTGALGGAGTMAITGSITNNILTVTAGNSAALKAGQVLTGTGLAVYSPAASPSTTVETRLVRQITATTWLVSATATAAAGTVMTVFDPPTHTSGTQGDGGVPLTFVADESAYLLNVGGDGSGQINDFTITGVRIELRSNRAKVLKGGDLNTGSTVKLLGVNLSSVVGGYRTTMAIAESALKVDISGGNWARIGTYEEPLIINFGAAPDSGYFARTGGAPIVSIGGGCRVSRDIHDLVSWATTSSAAVTLDETVTANCVMGLPNDTARYEQPDLLVAATLRNPTGTGTGAKGGNLARRLVTHRVAMTSFPSKGGTANPAGRRSRLTLPPGAVIMSTRVFKSAGGGNGNPINLRVVNDDMGDVIATFDPIASASVGFDRNVANLSYAIGQAARTIRLEDTGTADAGSLAPVFNSRFWEVTVSIP